MKKNVFIYLGLVFLMTSCYPEKQAYYEDFDLIFTNYEKSFDFESQGTYSMPDRIVKVNGDLAEGELPEYLPEPFNTEILQSIEENMTANGWTLETDSSKSDIKLLPAVWTNTTIYYWNNYWCWYYPYYCGWGYYPPSTASYTSGTLMMALVAEGDMHVEPDVVWKSAINGILSGSYNINRVKSSIDQAFNQSPYLNIK